MKKKIHLIHAGLGLCALSLLATGCSSEKRDLESAYYSTDHVQPAYVDFYKYPVAGVHSYLPARTAAVEGTSALTANTHTLNVEQRSAIERVQEDRKAREAAGL